MWHPRSIKEYRLNSVYNGGSLDTYGVDVGYSITPEFETSIGYYYQKGDLGTVDGSGVKGRVAYNIGSGFSIGTNLSYDDAFDGRVSADILYRFASPKATTASINKAWNAPTIKGLSDTVSNRDVRVHDPSTCENAWRDMAMNGAPSADEFASVLEKYCSSTISTRPF